MRITKSYKARPAPRKRNSVSANVKIGISQSSQFHTMSKQSIYQRISWKIASLPKTPMQCPIAMPLFFLFPSISRSSPSRSQSRHARRPPFPYPLHIIPKPLARDPPPALAPQRRMLIRVVKRILQQSHVRALHGPKHRPQLRIPQPSADAAHRRSRRRSSRRRGR